MHVVTTHEEKLEDIVVDLQQHLPSFSNTWNKRIGAGVGVYCKDTVADGACTRKPTRLYVGRSRE